MAHIKKVQGMFSWVVVLSECSHVFCCVLPTIFSVVSVLVGLGVVGVMPLWMEEFHHVMHAWEVPMILFSALVVCLGWGVHYLGCILETKAAKHAHDHCAHESCEKADRRTHSVLRIATFLFVVNVSIYMIFHDGMHNFIDSFSGHVNSIEEHVH